MITLIAAGVFYIYAPNIDIATGQDFKEYPTGNTLSCEARCTEEVKCKGFIVSRVQGKCWLKSTLEGIKAIKVESVGGIKVSDP